MPFSKTGRLRGISVRTIVMWFAALSAVVYLIIVPFVNAYFEQFEERPTSYVIEELNAFEILRIRSAKLIVFALFAYLGACVGSFLNVVASSAPRGESIGFRSSVCPSCSKPIRRIDNVPLFSYLRLKGRCRSCGVPIPLRYFGVELIGLGIFASLFLFELITGAANVPGFTHYMFVGILWIILYTKWPVIGIYFFHAITFSCVLMFALMEIDGLRSPRRMSIVIVVVFASLAIAAPLLLPVAFDDQIPLSVSDSLPSWLARAIASLIGGLVGWMIALIVGRISSVPALAVPWILLGVTLGWQATVTIGLLWMIASLLIRGLMKSRRPSWLGPTALLLAVSLLHHPFWKWLFRFW